ncbi:MAG: 50S ribosomal protein L6 [Proteobacteria bacterium]|nr:50S ribosomal protein L6 [Pseudomonadota bacterium]
MSRIGKAPIAIPAGVDVNIGEGVVTVKGAKGELSLNLLSGIELKQEDGQLSVEIGGNEKLGAMSGTTRALINNMVTGVSEGFEKKLSIIGVGYRAKAQGKSLNLQLGFSHDINYDLPEGVTAETPTQTEIIVRGSDKQRVGQAAANIRAFRPPEPYKGKGIRYTDEYVVRKQAKKA